MRETDKYYDTWIPFLPTVGCTYENVSGDKYKCLYVVDDIAIMQDVTSKLTFTTSGIRRYPDNKIDWEYSSSGYF